MLTIDIIGRKNNTVNDALYDKGHGKPSVKEAERPIAPPSGVDEGVGSSAEEENEWELGRHEDAQSIGEDSADLSGDCLVAVDGR